MNSTPLKSVDAHNLKAAYRYSLSHSIEHWNCRWWEAVWKTKKLLVIRWAGIGLKYLISWDAVQTWPDTHNRSMPYQFLHAMMLFFSHASGVAPGMAVSVGPHWNSSTSIRWIKITFCPDVQMMNPHNFADPLTFPLVPPWSLHLWCVMKCFICHRL